ncbi:hypothetical protein BASA61_009238 [Batrachochytrium salamandrivorans]|nr:hypothetical protein BASA61_009238 [Batrachochytrium salamandrivorans]
MILSLIAVAAIAAARRSSQNSKNNSSAALAVVVADAGNDAGNDNTVQHCHPSHASLWDRLPFNVQDRVLTAAGPLTQFLCGRLPPNSDIRAAKWAARLVWQDAMQLGWVGDFDLLPDSNWSMQDLVKDLQLVQSRETFVSLTAAFPPSLFGILVNVPMRHLWLDLLDLTDPMSTSLAATTHGHIRLLNHILVEKQLCPVTGDHFMAAARSGYPEVIAFLYSLESAGVKDPVQELAHAACYGNLAIMDWIRDNQMEALLLNPETCSIAMMNAAQHGQVAALHWLHECLEQSVSPNVMDMAAQAGNIDMVIFLHENRTEGCSKRAMDVAATHGYYDIVVYLDKNRTEGCTVAAMDGAAAGGYIEIVKFLHHNRTEGCSTKAMDSAAAIGRLDILQFIHSYRTEGCTTCAMDSAAGANHVHVLQWLHDNRTEGCTIGAMDAAAARGSIGALEWLQSSRTEGCSVAAMDDAAKAGQLSSVHWLHEFRTEGCTTSAIHNASSNGHLDIVRFLLEHRQEGFLLDTLKTPSTIMPEIMGLLHDHLHLCRDLPISQCKEILPDVLSTPSQPYFKASMHGIATAV